MNLQYECRKGRSAVNAIMRVVDTARDAIEGERWTFGTKEYCAIITLDSRNSAQQIEGRIKEPYLMEILNNYFQDRKVIDLTDEGEQVYVVTGSVLEPLLWNIMHDEVLRLQLPNGTTIVGFADDIAIISVAKTNKKNRGENEHSDLKCWSMAG